MKTSQLMKTVKQSVALAVLAAAFTLSSCSNDYSPLNADPVAVRFTSSIAGQE